MKFKILPKVRSFTDAKGIEYKPGDIVDLPESYKGENWLEPVEKAKKVEVPPAKVEPVAPVPAAEEKSAVPLGKLAKKSRSS